MAKKRQFQASASDKKCALFNNFCDLSRKRIAYCHFIYIQHYIWIICFFLSLFIAMFSSPTSVVSGQCSPSRKLCLIQSPPSLCSVPCFLCWSDLHNKFAKKQAFLIHSFTQVQVASSVIFHHWSLLSTSLTSDSLLDFLQYDISSSLLEVCLSKNSKSNHILLLLPYFFTKFDGWITKGVLRWSPVLT